MYYMQKGETSLNRLYHRFSPSSTAHCRSWNTNTRVAGSVAIFLPEHVHRGGRTVQVKKRRLEFTKKSVADVKVFPEESDSQIGWSATFFAVFFIAFRDLIFL